MVADLPQEIVDKIIDEIALDPCRDIQDQARDMKMLSVVSPKWLHRSRKHLFHTLKISSHSFPWWCNDVRPGVDGPSRHITHLRYRPSLPEAERMTGPLDGLAYSPSHMSSFINLQTLHFVSISLEHAGYVTCFEGLTPVVRELWLEDCQMDINQFVSFIRPFTNLKRLRLMRPQCPEESKLQDLVPTELPPLRGILEYHHPTRKAAFQHIVSFIHELSLVPSSLNTITFRERLDAPEVANELLAASRRTLTKLTFGHNTIPDGINLKHLTVLKELELSTLFVRPLPSIIRTIKSASIETIRFFILVHQFESGVDGRTRHAWSQLDDELCALADRLEAAKRYGCGALQINLVDLDPVTIVSELEEAARLYLPSSREHRYISLSAG